MSIRLPKIGLTVLLASGCATSDYSSLIRYTASDRFAYQQRVAALSIERRDYRASSYVDIDRNRARAAHRRQINSHNIKRDKRRARNIPDERQRELVEYRRLVESLRTQRPL